MTYNVKRHRVAKGRNQQSCQWICCRDARLILFSNQGCKWLDLDLLRISKSSHYCYILTVLWKSFGKEWKLMLIRRLIYLHKGKILIFKHIFLLIFGKHFHVKGRLENYQIINYNHITRHRLASRPARKPARKCFCLQVFLRVIHVFDSKWS